MRLSRILLCGLWVFSGSRVSRAQYFTDMFTGNSLNSSYWQSAAPFSDSSVIETGGTLAISNGGWIISNTVFPSAVDITVKFAITGSIHDNLKVWTRTNGAMSNGAFTTGVFFQVQVETDPGSTQNNIIITGANGVLATATYPISVGQNYTMRAVDDGTNLLFYVNDTSTPLVTATDSAPIPHRIAIIDRAAAGAGSFINAGSQVKLSALTINNVSVVTNTVTNTVTVPDTRGRLINLSTLGNGGYTMGFVINGTTAQTVLIRGVGPTLKNFNVSNSATQTTLTLYSGTTVIGANSGWSAASNAAQVVAAFASTQAFALPAGSTDSVILTTLNPGAYTATVSGNGAVLLEVYAVPSS